MKVKAGLEAEYAEYVKVNSNDSYSKRIVTYGEDWANLMEPRIEQGDHVKNIAGDYSHQANTDGITGFMYGAAVSALAHFWEYGDDLRRWSNKDISPDESGTIANESGEVINPAIITISNK